MHYCKCSLDRYFVLIFIAIADAVITTNTHNHNYSITSLYHAIVCCRFHFRLVYWLFEMVLFSPSQPVLTSWSEVLNNALTADGS